MWLEWIQRYVMFSYWFILKDQIKYPYSPYFLIFRIILDYFIDDFFIKYLIVLQIFSIEPELRKRMPLMPDNHSTWAFATASVFRPLPIMDKKWYQTQTRISIQKTEPMSAFDLVWLSSLNIQFGRSSEWLVTSIANPVTSCVKF